MPNITHDDIQIISIKEHETGMGPGYEIKWILTSLNMKRTVWFAKEHIENLTANDIKMVVYDDANNANKSAGVINDEFGKHDNFEWYGLDSPFTFYTEDGYWAGTVNADMMRRYWSEVIRENVQMKIFCIHLFASEPYDWRL